MPSYRDALHGGEINDLVAYLMTRRASTMTRAADCGRWWLPR